MFITYTNLYIHQFFLYFPNKVDIIVETKKSVLGQFSPIILFDIGVDNCAHYNAMLCIAVQCRALG